MAPVLCNPMGARKAWMYGDGQFVSEPLPAPLVRQGVSARLAFIFAAAALLTCAIGMQLGVIDEGSLVMVALVGGGLSVGLAIEHMLRRHALRKYRGLAEHAIDREALFALVSKPRRSWFRNWPLWNWKAMRAVYEKNGITPPRAIVGSQALAEIDSIPRADDLLEAESIGASGVMPTAFVVIAAVFGMLVAVMMFRDGRYLGSAAIGVFLVLLLFQHPKVRDAVPGLARMKPEPVAGVGWVRDPKGRTWTAANAMMVIGHAHQSKAAVVVHLVGDAGSLTLTFQSAADPEFIMLWERWSHLHPRPDLAG